MSEALIARVQDLGSLRLEDLSYRYEFDGSSVFEGATFDIPRARAVWVRSSGSRGKSTLLKLLAGLYRPTQGRYLIGGVPVQDMSFEEFLPYRLSMGYGFDMGGLLNNKTLFENLTLPLTYHKLMPTAEITPWVERFLQHFNLMAVRHLRPYAVSGSTRKMVCVMRAFVHQPRLVLLDDPLTGIKNDNLNDLFHYIDEAFGDWGLKQVIFTGENPLLARHLQAEELMLSPNWVTARAAA